MLGLRRVGPSRPLSKEALDAAERRGGLRFPPSYRALVETWGVGRLCGFVFLLDPTEPRAPTDAGARVVWAELDRLALAWDRTASGRDGEHPVWLIDRDGGDLFAGASLQEVVDDFLLGGALDRVLPPAPGGRWELPATYAIGALPDVSERLLAALRAGDEATAEALLGEERDASNGYDVSATLLRRLLAREADDLPRARRIAWLERAAEWARRCAPTDPLAACMPAIVATLRAGGSIDDVVPVTATVSADRAPLTVSWSVARWDTTHLECRAHNPGDATSAPSILEVEVEVDGERGRTFELKSIPPGAEERVSFGIPWPAGVPPVVRIALRAGPASLSAPALDLVAPTVTLSADGSPRAVEATIERALPDERAIGVSFSDDGRPSEALLRQVGRAWTTVAVGPSGTLFAATPLRSPGRLSQSIARLQAEGDVDGALDGLTRLAALLGDFATCVDDFTLATAQHAVRYRKASVCIAAGQIERFFAIIDEENLWHDGLVSELLAAKQFDACLRYLDRFGFPEHVLRARALAGLGRHAEAIAELERAPGNPVAKALIVEWRGLATRRPGLAVGDRVSHTKFGAGAVVSVAQSATGPMVRVRFDVATDGLAERSLLARFLTRLEA